jgi:hypothetical protein
MNVVKQTSFDNFITVAIKRFGWTEERIKDELRKQYRHYDPKKEQAYLHHLQLLKDQEYAEQPEEKERRRQLAEEQYGPEKCPICGAPTKPSLEWYDKYQHIPGWTCTAGGIRHFMWWKINNIKRLRGEPILFPEEGNNVLEHDEPRSDTQAD